MRNPLSLCKFALLLAVASQLIGCVWLRLYETKTQLARFDTYFAVETDEVFKLQFKAPVIYSSDLRYLMKLQASQVQPRSVGQAWSYHFYKLDSRGKRVEPPVAFSFTMNFNGDDRLASWILSPMFLSLVPAEFLEASLRSVGHGEILRGKRQLRVNSGELSRVDESKVPGREQILANLGEPLDIRRAPGEVRYLYHFQLQTRDIEKGYEDRALSEVKLYFDPATDKLTRMSGRFAGLKISIDYRAMSSGSGSGSGSGSA